MNVRDCKVREFKPFGLVEGSTYYFALYCLVPTSADPKVKCGHQGYLDRYYDNRALAVFVQEKGTSSAGLLFKNASVGPVTFYSAPEIIQGKSYTLLHFPIIVDGTGNYNESDVYALDRGSWTRVDIESWLHGIRANIPESLDTRKGIWPDYRTMTAETGLYKKDDPECCASGGRAYFKLGLEKNKIVLKEVVVKLGDP